MRIDLNNFKYIKISLVFYLTSFTKLKLVDNDSLQKYCLKLEDFLKYDVYYDIDGLDLSSKLNILKEILQIKDYTSIDILNYIKRLNSFPNHALLIGFY